jgi:hypothetical protein
MNHDHDELAEIVRELTRQDIGVDVDRVLDDCAEHHALQGEVAQMTVEFVRDRLAAIFVNQDEDE